MENPFLTPPQVESAQSRSWARGFAFGLQGPAQSSMTPADIQPEDPDAFDQGVLAGQDAAINGIPAPQPCVDLNAETSSGAHARLELEPPGAMFAFGLGEASVTLTHLAGSLVELVLLVIDVAIASETFFDDAEDRLSQAAPALQQQLQDMGFSGSMELFLGAGLDLAAAGCELRLAPVQRSQDAAVNAARGIGRAQWFVASWRTDQSGGATIVASSQS
jgi:hypothetical protein